MASLFNNFWKGAKGLKVKELAPYTAQYSKDHLTYSKLRPQFKEGLDVSPLEAVLHLSCRELRAFACDCLSTFV